MAKISNAIAKVSQVLHDRVFCDVAAAAVCVDVLCSLVWYFESTMIV